MVRAVRLGVPEQGNLGVALSEHVLDHDVRADLNLGGVGHRLGRPWAEAVRDPGVQIAGHAELRVDRGTAQVFGERVLDVGVAGGADADGYVLSAVAVQDVCQRGLQQHCAGLLPHLGKLGFEGRDGVVRIVVADDERVAGESVRAGMAAGHEAGDVDPGHCRKDRVVPGEGDASSRELGEVRGEFGCDLGGLKSVESDYEYASHRRLLPVMLGGIGSSR